MKEYNIIGLDPSLISTGMTINGKVFNYCRESDAYSKSGLSKWFKLSEEHLTLNFVEYRKFGSYSEGELTKLKDYDKVTSQIIKDIEQNIDKTRTTKIAIEGFSYSSNAGAIIDLVTFSTLLRKKLFDYISQDITIFSPASLKLEACKLTYAPIDIGKKKEKLVYKNNEGVSGGSLTKHGIYQCIIENENLVDEWTELCRSLKSEIMAATKVPKPFEDANDSFILYQILKNSNSI